MKMNQQNGDAPRLMRTWGGRKITKGCRVRIWDFLLTGGKETHGTVLEVMAGVRDADDRCDVLVAGEVMRIPPWWLEAVEKQN